MSCWTARLIVSLAVVVSACSSAAPKSAMPTQLLPAQLPSADDAEAKHVLRVRVYAGSAYRARVVGWESELEKVIAASSAILQKASATRLELVESLDWKLAGAKLKNSLRSLSAFDPAVDVDLVIGLIDAAAEAEVEYARLMEAQPFGKHMVIRSFNRQAESEALGDPAADLDEGTKDELLDRRRRHKQSMIVARAVASLFGAPAEGSYETTQSKLDSRAAKTLRVTIAATLRAAASDEDSESIWAEASEALAALELPAETVKRAREQGLIRDGKSTQEEEEEALRSVDRETLARAKELLKDGAPAEAWQALEPLTELYGKNLEIVELACQVAFMRGASDAMDRCLAATALNPQSGSSWLRRGRLQLAVNHAGALQSLKRAGKTMKEGEAGWMSLARAYQKLSLPTLALDAAAKAKKAKPDAALNRWGLETRSRYGSTIGVDTDSEGRYLVALKDALTLVYKSNYKAAQAAASDLRSSFPKSIAADFVLCEIALRRRKYDATKRSCNAVLDRQADNAWARYLLGVMSQRTRKQSEAIEHWKAAIKNDPGLKAAYEALSKVYRKSSDPRLAALKKEYKEQFGSELK